MHGSYSEAKEKTRKFRRERDDEYEKKRKDKRKGDYSENRRSKRGESLYD